MNSNIFIFHVSKEIDWLYKRYLIVFIFSCSEMLPSVKEQMRRE